MRSVLPLALLIAVCASTGAEAREHYSRSRHVARPVRAPPPGPGTIPTYTAPSGARIYRDDSVPGGVRTYRDAPPAFNDPSKFGGA